MKPYHIGLGYTLLIALLAGCRPSPNPQAVIASGRANLTCVKEFVQWFPEAAHFLSSRKNGEVIVWNSEARFNGRYVLTMQFDVAVDDNKIAHADSPSFYFREIEKVEQLPDGRIRTQYARGKEKRFGEDDWKRVVTARGDLSVLGISIERDTSARSVEAAPDRKN